jgi:hypothetical protein
MTAMTGAIYTENSISLHSAILNKQADLSGNEVFPQIMTI